MHKPVLELKVEQFHIKGMVKTCWVMVTSWMLKMK